MDIPPEFVAAHRIADIFFDAAESMVRGDRYVIYMNYTRSKPQSCLYQTRRGVVLRIYYGAPMFMWTPWGEWQIAGSGGGPGVHEHAEAVLRQLRTEPYELDPSLASALTGPLLQVIGVGDITLPPPGLLSAPQFRTNDVVQKEWGRLLQQYARQS